MISSKSTLRPARGLSAFALAGLLAAACGSASENATTSAPETAAPTTTSATSGASDTTVAGEAAATSTGRFALPDTNVLDVADRSEVNLSTIAGDKPILLWFYAPH